MSKSENSGSDSGTTQTGGNRGPRQLVRRKREPLMKLAPPSIEFQTFGWQAMPLPNPYPTANGGSYSWISMVSTGFLFGAHKLYLFASTKIVKGFVKLCAWGRCFTDRFSFCID